MKTLMFILGFGVACIFAQCAQAYTCTDEANPKLKPQDCWHWEDHVARHGPVERPQVNEPHSVPEPASIFILATGVGLIAARRRRRK